MSILSSIRRSIRKSIRNSIASSSCDFYLFSSTSPDSLQLGAAFTGNLKVLIKAPSETGLNPAIVAGRQGAFVVDEWMQYEISAAAITYIVGTTFDGRVAYAKDNVWFNVDMGEANFRWYARFNGVNSQIQKTILIPAGETLTSKIEGVGAGGATRMILDSIAGDRRMFVLGDNTMRITGLTGIVTLDGQPVVDGITQLPIDGNTHEILVTPLLDTQFDYVGYSRTNTAPAYMSMWDFAMNGTVFMSVDDSWLSNPTIATGGTAINFSESMWYEAPTGA